MSGVAIGPTWSLTPDGRRPLPKLSLGWEVIEWAEMWLLQPDGPRAGESWKFTDEQQRFILWFYELDERLRFVNRRAVYRRMKGAGKNPLAAVLCAVEFVGPCRPNGGKREVDGEPAGAEHQSAWVQTAAVSREQTRNSMSLMPSLFSPAAIEAYGIDLGKEIIYAHRGRARFEAVTSSPRALEGGRATFVVMDETHHWIRSNEGHAMADVIARNAAKSRDGASRVLAITNAHDPGEDSVAERDYQDYLKIAAGKSVASGFLYDSLEAPADTELAPVGTGENGEVTTEDWARARASLYRGLDAARGDAKWLDIDRLIEEIRDPRTSPSMSRRFYLNQIVSGEEAWIRRDQWDERADTTKSIAPGDLITVGADGSKANDHTVISICRVSDAHIDMVKAFDPEDYYGSIPLDLVKAEIERLFGMYDVVGFFCDRQHFESTIMEWEQSYGNQLCVRATQLRPIEWDMSQSKKAGLTAMAYHDAILEGAVTHSGNPELAQYHYNARRHVVRGLTYEDDPENRVFTFGKESAFSSKKVDGLASSMLAWKARQDYLALPEARKRQVVQTVGVTWARNV